MDFWYKAVYGIQLIAACSIVIFFSPRKQNFWLRYLLSAGITLVWSCILGLFYDQLIYIIGRIGFWILFPPFLVGMLYGCCEYNLRQVLYYVTVTMAVQHIAYDFCILVDGFLAKQYLLVDILIYFAVYTAMYFFIQNIRLQVSDIPLVLYDLFPMVTIVFVVQIISVIQVLGNTQWEGMLLGNVCYRLVDALCCTYVLWTQVSRKKSAHYEAELVGINQAFLLQKEQYAMRQETIDSINRKCHDLKHQLDAFYHTKDSQEREAYYQELKKDIRIYDMDLDTGNEALNVLLMDKGLYCYEKNIRLNCAANMAALSFMRLDDVYAMFGNAIDNAIEAVDQLHDPEKRIINLKVSLRKNLLIIQLQNYYEENIAFENGLPLTTKNDKLNHGFGVKSIRFIAEKYGGTMTACGKNQIFTMQILLPVAGT